MSLKSKIKKIYTEISANAAAISAETGEKIRFW